MKDSRWISRRAIRFVLGVLKLQWIPLVVGLSIGLLFIMWDLESWQILALGWQVFLGIPAIVTLIFVASIWSAEAMLEAMEHPDDP